MDEVVTEMVDKLLADLDSGRRSLKEVTGKVSALAPGSSIAAILIADSTMVEFMDSTISLDEAEGIIHLQADLHPAMPSLFLMCAMLAIKRESVLDGRGYLALAKAKGEQYSIAEDVEEMLEESGMEALAALSDHEETSCTVRPYLGNSDDHLVNHLLVQGISVGDFPPDPAELDMILAREKQVVTILNGLCSDLGLEIVIQDPSDHLLYPVMLLGHFKDEMSIPPLLGMFHVCFGISLHEAVLALAKVGSRHPEPVSVGLKRVVEDPNWDEESLSAIEVLGLLWDRCDNLEFLLDTLDSLDTEDEYFQELFAFLAWSLLNTGQPEALTAVSDSLEKHRGMLSRPAILSVDGAIADFLLLQENQRLDALVDEDVRQIFRGPWRQVTSGTRETLTLIREREMDDGPWSTDEVVRDIDELLKIGRNQPCPCGGGREFENCCLPRLEEEKRRLLTRKPVEDEDVSDLMYLIARLFEFVKLESACSKKEYRNAEAEFLSPTGLAEFREFDFGELDIEHGLFLDWFLFSRPLDDSGKTVAEEFESRNEPFLPPNASRILQAIWSSAFSLYEVQKIFPGKCLLARDILRDETIWIESEETSKTVYRWDILGMRTAPVKGEHHIYSPIFSVPRDLREQILEYATSMCRDLVDDGSVSGMDEFLNRAGYLLFPQVNILKEKQAAPVVLTAEGDVLCVSKAIFDINDAPEANRLLGKHPYTLEAEGERQGQVRSYRWKLSPEMENELREGGHRDGPKSFERTGEMGPTGSMTIDDATGGPEETTARGLAMITVTSRRLTLETSSMERLEYGKREIEKMLPVLLTHRLDSLQDQVALMESAGEPGAKLPGQQDDRHLSPELESVMLRRHIDDHYPGWADRPLRALDGKTPRQATCSESGRKKVDILLKDFENMVERHSGADRPTYSFNSIREDLDVWPEIGDPVMPGGRPYQDAETQDEYHPQETDLIDLEMTDEVMDRIGIDFREKLESKPLPPGTRLRPALNKLPWCWTQGMCVELDLENPTRAPERVDVLEEHLTRPGSIEEVWEGLPDDSRRILYWLVIENGGFATTRELYRKFGPDDDYSWFWQAGFLPTSPLGLLRLNGLVFVGMATIKKHRVKIAAVAMELRSEITRLE